MDSSVNSVSDNDSDDSDSIIVLQKPLNKPSQNTTNHDEEKKDNKLKIESSIVKEYKEILNKELKSSELPDVQP